MTEESAVLNELSIVDTTNNQIIDQTVDNTPCPYCQLFANNVCDCNDD